MAPRWRITGGGSQVALLVACALTVRIYRSVYIWRDATAVVREERPLPMSERRLAPGRERAGPRVDGVLRLIRSLFSSGNTLADGLVMRARLSERHIRFPWLICWASCGLRVLCVWAVERSYLCACVERCEYVEPEIGVRVVACAVGARGSSCYVRMCASAFRVPAYIMLCSEFVINFKSRGVRGVAPRAKSKGK